LQCGMQTLSESELSADPRPAGSKELKLSSVLLIFEKRVSACFSHVDSHMHKHYGFFLLLKKVIGHRMTQT